MSNIREKSPSVRGHTYRFEWESVQCADQVSYDTSLTSVRYHWFANGEWLLGEDSSPDKQTAHCHQGIALKHCAVVLTRCLTLVPTRNSQVYDSESNWTTKPTSTKRSEIKQRGRNCPHQGHSITFNERFLAFTRLLLRAFQLLQGQPVRAPYLPVRLRSKPVAGSGFFR
jgi:hypothetical protein